MTGAEPKTNLRIAAGLALLAASAFVFRTWVATPVIVRGASMSPSWCDGQLAWLNKLTYQLRPPRRGDVVIVWTGKELLHKRIVGLPGEVVAVRDGVVYVNGTLLPEPYVQIRASWNVKEGKLGPNSYFVAGDNRSLPQRDCVLAVVTRDRLLGTVEPVF
ncbi:MAG: signal peptidase I [Verrucomicrobiia bacterium]